MGVKDDKKVFIIQSMAGKTDEEIKSERVEIVRMLNRSGYDVIDSWISEDAPMGCVHGGVYYLGRSLELMSWADYIYLAPGWETARGCLIEREVAERYGIPEAVL